MVYISICFIYIENSYEEVLSLPRDIQMNPRIAIIIPAFFHTGWSIYNGTLVEQVNSYDLMLDLKNRVLDRIPFTMKELLQCHAKGKCAPVKKHLFTHVWVFCCN